MTTITQNYTVLLETGNERLFTIGKHAASAVSGELTYIIRDENTAAIVFHVCIAGVHRKGILGGYDMKIKRDSVLVSMLAEQVK